MLETFNCLASLVLSIATGWAVMSPRVKDGIVIKIGLVCLSVGFVGIFFFHISRPDGPHPLASAQALVHLGVLICAAGYVLRTRRHSGVSKRRASDWVQPGATSCD
jgi:1,4-dihydroxy-2-naphthoate octaprenyltransferase